MRTATSIALLTGGTLVATVGVAVVVVTAMSIATSSDVTIGVGVGTLIFAIGILVISRGVRRLSYDRR